MEESSEPKSETALPDNVGTDVLLSSGATDDAGVSSSSTSFPFAISLDIV